MKRNFFAFPTYEIQKKNTYNYKEFSEDRLTKQIAPFSLESEAKNHAASTVRVVPHSTVLDSLVERSENLFYPFARCAAMDCINSVHHHRVS